jgi:aspartyl-tRNA(Asn)/glutamyl-tRNA(Gln) amidotransferase subunit A
MDQPLHFLDATELAHRIRARQLTSTQVVEAHLERIKNLNPKLNAIVTVNENALSEARAADEAVTAGRELGPLHGVPFTVKDSIDTADIPTQRGSPIFKGRVPEIDATSVARMKKAGGILLAKTNLPEFSYSTESENLLSGRTNNPWNLDRTPGGSSGGESAAIAAGLSPIGLGTDLAISVRGPAAQTGIVALKPTHGRIPMTGVWPRAPRRFWHTGPMARSIRDLELAYLVLAGSDGHDAFSSSTVQFDAGGTASNKRLKIGWMTGPGLGPVDPEVQRTVEAAATALQTFNFDVEKVRVPALERDIPLDVFTRLHVNEIQPAFKEATADQPAEKLFKISKAMLDAPETPMADFIDAQQAAERLRDGFAAFFEGHDALLCQVLPMHAHEHGMSSFTIDRKTYDRSYVMAATVMCNITGLPAISMRFGTSKDGLPIGVQLVGSWQAESTILKVAGALEEASNVAHVRPNL